MTDEHDDCSSCEEKETNPSDPNVMNKYKMAGEIAASVIKSLVGKCVVGANVYSLCKLGDQMIVEATSKVFVKEKKMKKGVGFPTCISINNCVCHFSPLNSDPVVSIADQDVVKIDLGVQIDGYISSVATTLCVGAVKAQPITGRKADVMMAAHMAMEAAIRLFRPGNTNHMITDIVTAVASEYKCRPVEGLLSHRTRKDEPEGESIILLNPTEAMKKDYAKVTFNAWDVYSLDIFISTSEDPKGKERDARTTVFRRSTNSYTLRSKTARETITQITLKHGEFAFSLSSFDDENKARLGIKECVEHMLVVKYPVLYDKDNESVAHFKFTVVVGPNGPIKVVMPLFSPDCLKTEYKIKNPEINKLLNEPLIKKPTQTNDNNGVTNQA